MTKMIDYADNIFFITEKTKLLEKGLALALIPGLFSEQLRRDTEFISDSLIWIRRKIDNSPHSLRRSENLRSLMLANQRFAQILPSLLEREFLSAETGNKMRAVHETQACELENNLINSPKTGGDLEQVSSQEFKFLLKTHGEQD